MRRAPNARWLTWLLVIGSGVLFGAVMQLGVGILPTKDAEGTAPSEVDRDPAWRDVVSLAGRSTSREDPPRAGESTEVPEETEAPPPAAKPENFYASLPLSGRPAPLPLHLLNVFDRVFEGRPDEYLPHVRLRPLLAWEGNRLVESPREEFILSDAGAIWSVLERRGQTTLPAARFTAAFIPIGEAWESHLGSTAGPPGYGGLGSAIASLARDAGLAPDDVAPDGPEFRRALEVAEAYRAERYAIHYDLQRRVAKLLSDPQMGYIPSDLSFLAVARDSGSALAIEAGSDPELDSLLEAYRTAPQVVHERLLELLRP